MQKKLQTEAEKYIKQSDRRRGWRKIVQAMACIVVFCTTYALILPAITMEKTMGCEIEEHTHSEKCYSQVTTQQVAELACTYESIGVHVHTEDCYDAETALICGYADYLVHEHEASCYDESGALVCQLPEVKAHAHTEEECYQTVEPVPAESHAHEAGCYTMERGGLICVIPETEGHAHTDSCYTKGEAPICGLEEKTGHTHGEGCSETVQICTLSTEPAHTHDDSCYQSSLICGQDEVESYSYKEETSETVLVCENTEEDHVHDETDCYQTNVTTHTVQVEGHAHGESCYKSTLACGLSDEAHVHGNSCYQTNSLCDLLEEEGHAHTDNCYDFTLTCRKEEKEGHSHGDECYILTEVLTCEADTEENETTEPELELVCEKEEIVLHSHENDCYEVTIDDHGEEQKVLVCTQIVVEEHVHGDSCFVTEEIPVDTEVLTCQLAQDETHTHNAMCYGTWEVICGLEEHTHDASCTPMLGLCEEDRAQVEYVIALIDEMPSADEIDAKIEEFEETEDYEGEEAYMMEAKQQVCEAYRMYRDLGEDLQSYVTNADKLLELEYIWSVQSYVYTTDGPTIYQINSYTNSNSTKSVMVFGGSVSEKVTYQFLYWYAIKVEKDSAGDYRVVEILQPGSSSDKSNFEASDTGFILLFYYTDTIPDAEVGDYVIVHFTVPETGVYKAAGYGTVSFSSSNGAINSAVPTVDDYTPTSSFVELNLYDYNYAINKYWDTTQGGNTKYPGFQWNGGAYSKADSGYRTSNTAADKGVPDYYMNRRRIDNIDFGNSLITNFDYVSGSSGSYSKASGSIGVGKLYDNSGSSSTGKINWLWYDGSDYASTTNRPVGMSTGYQSLSNVLSDGYPALLDGTSLAYLFNADKDIHGAVEKLNTQSIDGLFLQNPVSGMYSYNSRENHAQYSNNFFTRYKEIITPNFIAYPFGNFLPLNTISDPGKATQVGAFNGPGGMERYVDNIKTQLRSNTDSYQATARSQLLTMLEEYEESWEYDVYNGASWGDISPANAIRDYFQNANGDNPSDNTNFISEEFLNKVYNIDWDVSTNFFFGMEMKMTVMMPKDGLTGKDNGNNSESWTTTDDGTFIRTGSPDGIPDYPMVFNFSGDDDVWVYIDDVLFLDLSGIHRHVGGTIDFQTGTVYYFELDPASGDTHQHDPGTSSYYKKYSFSEILAAAGKDTSVLNDKGTFKDYTTHTFNFYYMERGSGSSVCRINFNFPMLRKNSINVTKENTDLSGGMLGDTVLGNPDYYFNIIQGNGLFVGPGSVTGIDEYLVMNSDGSYVKDENGADKVFKTDQYGIFSIKAGQTAIFEGINENSGEYYVQELIKSEDNDQYPLVYVNGVESRYNDIITWTNRTYFSGTGEYDAQNPTIGPHGYKWYGRSGQNTDSSSQASFYFEQQNRVDVSKLGSLSITKNLSAEVTSPSADTVYKMHVVLDGEPLPIGTAYTIGGQSHTVAETGIIPVKAGETAVISNIISGTRFEIWEDSGSAAGYFVSYDQENADEVSEETGNSISGIIRVDTDVSVTVTNSENAAKVEVPVTKQLSNGACEPDTEHTYSFTLTQTDGNGNDLTGDDAYTQTLTIPVTGTAVGTGKFTLTYSSADYSAETSFPQTCYYRITENGGMENTITDDAVYQAVVTVNRDGNGKISAELTSLTLKGNSVGSADFVNTLTSSLSLKKLVDGSASAQENETFNFTLKFTYNDAPLTGSYPAVAHNKDGTTVDLTANLKEDGSVVFNAFYHGEYLVISGLPLGTKWEITETDVKNYIASWKVNEAAGNNTGNNTANGEITAGGTAVIFTNTTTYVLPETGSAGITPYTMAGLVLMIFSMAYLMYRPKARRREEFESP